MPSAMKQTKSKKRAPPKQKQRKKICRKLGQADQLPGSAWSLWLHHICGTGPSWLYPIACLGHLLCLRVTEILNLRPKDFDLEAGIVKVQALKRQKETDKVMGEAAVNFVNKLKEDGFSVRRMKNTGMLGVREVLDAWYWPDDPEHYLFPASRRDCRLVKRGKDVVAKAIRRARATFRVPHIPDVNPSRIRSHSGRHRCINDMKQHNVEKEVGKKYARISDDGVYQHYGRLSAQQAGKKLKQNRELQDFWKNMYVPQGPAAEAAQAL